MNTPKKPRKKVNVEEASKAKKRRTPKHTDEHSDDSSFCAMCRLKTLEKAAFAGDTDALLAIYTIARQACSTLERLRTSGTTDVDNLITRDVDDIIRCMPVWPALVSNPDADRPWLDKLGSESFTFPIPIRRLAIRNTLPRTILLACFAIIEQLRELRVERLRCDDARIAKPLPSRKEILAKYWAVRGTPEELVFDASYRHAMWGRKESLHPEIDKPSYEPENEINRVIDMARDLLKATISDHERLKLVEECEPRACALENNATAIEEWFKLSLEILKRLVGPLESNPVLRTLAPNRGNRKANRAGAVESSGEIRTRIVERLKAPLNTKEGS